MAKTRDLGNVSQAGASSRFENGRSEQSYQGENGGQAGNRVSEEYARSLELVRRNPLSAVMTGFGLGLGFGLAVTLLVTRREPTWYEQNIAEPFQRLPQRLRRAPEAIESYLPASWKHR